MTHNTVAYLAIIYYLGHIKISMMTMHYKLLSIHVNDYLAVKIKLVKVAIGDISHCQPVDSKTHVLLLACNLNIMPLSIVQ